MCSMHWIYIAERASFSAEAGDVEVLTAKLAALYVF